MPRNAKKISQGNSAIEHFSFGVLALCYPMAAVKQIIAECGREARRVRSLPPEVMVFFVIGMSLFPDVGYREVLLWLTKGLNFLGVNKLIDCAKSSISAARQRLGAMPMRLIFDRLVNPVADENLSGSFWRGLHLVVLDGSTLALQDTAANAKAYGRPSNQHGGAAWPLLRFVALAEAGTHIIFKAVLGGYNDSEITLAEKIVCHLKPGMLCLADRLFPGYALWKAASAAGSDLLWRAKTGLRLTHFKTLGDGSWLAHWRPGGKDRINRGAEAILVRVIEYKIKRGATGDPEVNEQTYRIITTLLEHKHAPAEELAKLYTQRWEIELTIKEAKTILRKGQVTLRSQLPELVEQEFWGMLLAHHTVRRMMAQAAMDSGADPDNLSYTGCLEIVKTTVAGNSPLFPPGDTGVDHRSHAPANGADGNLQQPGEEEGEDSEEETQV